MAEWIDRPATLHLPTVENAALARLSRSVHGMSDAVPSVSNAYLMSVVAGMGAFDDARPIRRLD
ncbi:hypothetical protein [Salinisphaera aquimarina]|uniref:Uncharacterized protein n=1 Tax=Salinisphaera aquimarina TaxID=2094031 RepID=A0ABV7EM41_9GAMM